MGSTLEQQEIEGKLKDLPGWRVEAGRLVREEALGSFAEAMDFANDVAAVAEEQDHHPDILIQYDQVRLELWTRSKEAITSRDVGLAREINRRVR